MNVSEITEVLARHDPMGLTDFGAPQDEYRPEAETIAPRLDEAGSTEDVQVILTEEFTRWFGDELSPPAERFAAAALELWSEGR